MSQSLGVVAVVQPVQGSLGVGAAAWPSSAVRCASFLRPGELSRARKQRSAWRRSPTLLVLCYSHTVDKDAEVRYS